MIIKPALIGLVLTATSSFPAFAAAGLNNDAAPSLSVPIPRLAKVIDYDDHGGGLFGSEHFIKALAYSPDGNYLAIGYIVDPNALELVVWDLLGNKQQTRIHHPMRFSTAGVLDLLWSHDSKIISLGMKQQWVAQTGQQLPDNPVVGGRPQLTKDGSKLLTIFGSVGKPSYIYVYDTQSWALQKIDMEGLLVNSAAWTADGNIMVGVENVFRNKNMDGRMLSPKDLGLRLIDPSGSKAVKALWYPATPGGGAGTTPATHLPDVDILATSLTGNKVAIGIGHIIDADTMTILKYWDPQLGESAEFEPGVGGVVFSRDGHYLFVKSVIGAGDRSPVVNSIIEVNSGKRVGHFEGGDTGIAINPNGKELAVGSRRKVDIFSLN